MEDAKIKLGVLWLFVALSMAAIVIVSYMAPGAIDEIMTGEFIGMQIDEGFLLIMALTYFWVPAVMAVLSIILKNRINRWLNIIVGAVYAVFVLIELIMNLTTIVAIYGVLMDISAIVASVLIVWYAYKWK